MPKHEKKEKKRKENTTRHVLDLNELKDLAKAHRYNTEKEKKKDKRKDTSVSKPTAKVPQTKAEHDKEQNVVKKVVDPLTGRTRSVWSEMKMKYLCHSDILLTLFIFIYFILS